MSEDSNSKLDLLREQELALKRIIALKEAETKFLSFVRLTMPDPIAPADPDLSRYETAPFHKVIAKKLEEVEAGTAKRVIITLPPRHGKTELGSKKFPPWFLGKNPYKQVIATTYSETYAQDIGKEVRSTFLDPVYKQIFPNIDLRKDSKSASLMKTVEGGQYMAAGMGGAITGRGADVLLIDDPIKNDEEAGSPLIRDKQWNWFVKTARTRLMPGGAIVIIMTRWHEDDIVGRLVDPENDHYNAEEAKLWEVIRMPAISEDDDDAMGREMGDALWPERYPVEELEAIKRLDARSFTCLYQNNPAPEEGNFFTLNSIHTYKPHELPRLSDMRLYCTSDHAVSTKQVNDFTCLTPFGIDSEDTIWILPEVWWQKEQSDIVVDAMVDLMVRYKPIEWFAESGHISKSLGPFLHKRMVEEEVYTTTVKELHPSADKRTRAQSTRGRMEMGKMRFPDFTSWWASGKSEILRFPHGKHDDFVDSLSLIGMGLGRHIPSATKVETKALPSVNSGRYLMEANRSKRNITRGGGF